MEIVVHTVVKYQTGWYRVTSVTKNTVNLGPVFGGKVIHKKVPKKQVKEDLQGFYDWWSTTESYQSM